MECVDGDLFPSEIDKALALGLRQHGEHWRLWGRWVYDNGDLVALLSKAYKGLAGAYAVKRGYEESIQGYKFKE